MPKVLFLQAEEVGGHEDQRRKITDVVIRFPEAFASAVAQTGLLQTKTVAMTSEAVKNGLVVGNHYHTPESNRHELFVATGPEGELLFKFAYVSGAADATAEEIVMARGDACYVPPGITHAFVPLVDGAELVGYSNQAYCAEHDVPHKIL